MKNILLAGSALLSGLVFATTAQAADMPAAGYDWSGFYAGVNAGVGINNSSIDNEVNVDDTRIDELESKIEGDQTAFTGGALLGYNWQMDKVVLGIEADFNYIGFSQDDERDWQTTGYTVGPTIDGSSKVSSDANWFGTVRGRLGYAADNVLFYGTGGLAYGHMEADAKLKLHPEPAIIPTDGEIDASTSSTNFGWTVGAGMEYGIDNWSLGVEYLYVDLGSAEWDGNTDAGSVPADLKGSVDYQFSVVRATAKMRF